MTPIEVVCGIISSNDKIFIARRKQGKSMAGKWEFPGGKREAGESDIQALKRELREEFGMAVDILNRFGSNFHDYENFSIKLTAYNCEFIGASFNLTDHDKYAWVFPNDLIKFEFASADLPFVKLISENLQ
ncbi:MAG: (deoxy)nucleoside triphosphate pyrophosphohydrolase [Flavobacterium sp.]|nr:MAG: (deoxy)nucleoside triphosphate pyrophosphohydrolase [Flavobacterium sp.]